MSDRPDRKRLLLLFFLGIVLWQVAFNTLLLPQHSFLKYPINAQKFLDHPVPDDRWLDFSPLYFFLHLGLAAIGIHSWSVIPTLQILLSALALWLFYRTARTFAGEGAALAVAGLAAAYPAYNFYVFCEEPELLLFLLNMAGLYFTVARPSPAGAGGAFALSVMTRPSALPLALLAGLFQKKRRWLYFLPVAAALAFLLVFSWWATGAPTLAYMSPGTVFYEGNNPEAQGIASMYPPVIKLWESAFSAKEADYAHVLYRRASAAEAGRPLSLTEHHRFWAGKALAFLSGHPGAAIRLGLRKLRLAFGNAEVHDIFSLTLVQRRMGPFGTFGFGLFAALGLLGAAAAWRRAPPLVLWGTAWSLATLCIFYFTSRQRMGFLGFMLFLAALGVEAIRRRPQLLLPAAALFALTLLPPRAMTAYHRMDAEIHAAGGLRMDAKRWDAQRDFPRAAEAMTRCIAAAPYLAPIHPSPFIAYDTGDPYSGALRRLPPPEDPYNRGLLHFFALEDQEALLAFEEVRRRPAGKHFYAIEPPLYYIAISQERLGRSAEAEAALDEALRRFPGNAAVEGLARALGRRVPPGRYHDRLTADYFTGRALFLLDRYADALPLFERAAETAPEILILREQITLCQAYTGHFQAMAVGLDSIRKTDNQVSMLPHWQRVARGMEQRFGTDPLYDRFIGRLRMLFPPPAANP